MNVGIITLWESNNYGGVLQAYATQTVLERFGHRAFVVPVRYHGRKKDWLKVIERPVKHIVDTIKTKKFAPFRVRYLKTGGMSPCSVQECLASPVPADALVCGSDQVWNPGVCSKAELRRLFFLDFGAQKIKRIAYAASWGTQYLDPSVKTELATSLKRFHSVSVREKSGVGIAAELGCSAVWLPDPTLLLDAPEWGRLAETAERPIRQNTLFQCEYRWKPCVPFVPVVRTLTSQLGLRQVIPFSDHLIRDMAYTRCLTPPEWVDGIRKAEFVVTNSFHGMVFSIIFRRPFITIPLIGKYAGMNERIYSLAERLGLDDRLLATDEPERIAALANTPINWEEVERRLADWRKEAYAFLTAALD